MKNATVPMAAGTFSVSTNSNTVNYSSSGAQNIGAAVYHNLTVSGGGTKSLTGNCTVNGTLTLSAGNIITGSNVLILLNSDPAALFYTSGIVEGKFERYIGVALSNYFFPVGTAVQIQSLTSIFCKS